MEARAMPPISPLAAVDDTRTETETESVQTTRTLSIVIPLYEEEDNVDAVLGELLDVLDAMHHEAEVVLVDDGSKDATAVRAAAWSRKDDRVLTVLLRRNFGQTAAIAAGIQKTTGGVIILMDGDLQNDPRDIPALVARMDDGFEVVSGWRKDRKDKLILRRLPSQAANRLISRVTKTHLHDFGCTLKAYDGNMLRDLALYGELHRFIPALAANAGARVTEVAVNHRPRVHGRSKYGISRTVRVLLDLLTVKFMDRYLTRPIQLFGMLGLGCFLLGAATIAWLVLDKLMGSGLSGRPLLLLAVGSVIVGVQFLCIGLLGELLVRMRHESGRRPYIIATVLGSGLDLRGEELGTNR